MVLRRFASDCPGFDGTILKEAAQVACGTEQNLIPFIDFLSFGAMVGIASYSPYI
jgi:hypothetical protein